MCMPTKRVYIYIQAVLKLLEQTLKGDRGHQKDSDLIRNTLLETSCEIFMTGTRNKVTRNRNHLK